MANVPKKLIAKYLNNQYAVTSTFVNQSVDVDEYFSEVIDVKLLKGLRREALANCETTNLGTMTYFGPMIALAAVLSEGGYAVFSAIGRGSLLLNTMVDFFCVVAVLFLYAVIMGQRSTKQRLAHLIIKEAIEQRLAELQK